MAILLLFASKVNAQQNIINTGTNGKFKYTLLQSISHKDTSYAVEIIYKGEQSIYKEITDTIHLNNAAAIKEFSNALQNTIESIADSKANPYFEKPTYSLYKLDKGVIGIFVSISNTNGNIIANATKSEALDFLNWLKQHAIK